MTKSEPALTATVEIEIPFQDGDPMGVTWHGNYFRYLEEARCALLKELDYGYRQMIASEVKRTTDQWNPLMIAFGKPHEADFPEALMKLPMKERILLLRDTWNFVVLYKEFKWGRKIMRESIERMIKGKYVDRRGL